MRFFRLAKLGTSLRARLSLTTVGLIMGAILAVGVVSHQRLSAKIAEDIAFRTEWGLRVAVKIFSEGIPLFSVEKNATSQPESLKLNQPVTLLDNFSVAELTYIVDTISEANRGAATIFRWREEKKDYERIATTIKKPDGAPAIGTFLGQGDTVYPFMMRKSAYRGVAEILGEAYQTGYLPIVDDKGNPVGILYIGVGKMKDLTAASSQFLRDIAIGCVIILGLAVLLTIVTTDRLLRPLGRVADATNALASGSEGVEIPHRDRADQIGVIARAVEGFSEAVARQRAHEQESHAEAARALARKTEMDRMVSEFRTSIRDHVEQLRAGADKVRVTSEDIRAVVDRADTRVGEGGHAAEDGARAIAEVAIATNQFASSITEIAARSNDAAGIVRKAAETGHRAETVALELTGAVEKIATAVAFISSIAAQTNLLALNATIEAARAGEAGKGFAVVAAEVKELSNGTSRAATEIADLVRGIEGVTQSVATATREIGEGLGLINETTLIIASAVTEQEQVTRNIAANADSASERSAIVRSGFSDVKSAIEDTVTASNSLDALSREFAVSSDKLVQEIEDFLGRMAA